MTCEIAYPALLTTAYVGVQHRQALLLVNVVNITSEIHCALCAQNEPCYSE